MSVKNGHMDRCLCLREVAGLHLVLVVTGRNSFWNIHECCSRHDFGVSYLMGVLAAHASSLHGFDVMERSSEVP